MALKFNTSDTNYVGGSPEGGAYGPMGVGNSSEVFREATIRGKGPGQPGGARSQGETAGVGSVYSVQLNERPNLSNPRNRGPERAPSAAGASGVPVTTQGSRATGRVSG